MYVNEIKELERGLNLLKPYLTSVELSDANRKALNEIVADGLALHEVLTLADAESVDVDDNIVDSVGEWVRWVDETMDVLAAQ